MTSADDHHGSGSEPGGSPATPDEALVRVVITHAMTQLHKGWGALETARNVRARYSLTEDSAKRLVAVLIAGRTARPTDEAGGIDSYVAVELDLPPEVAAEIVAGVRSGLIDPDEPSTVVLELDPERAALYAEPPIEPDAEPAPHPPAEGAPSPMRSRAVGPIRLEVNLLPDPGDQPTRRKGGLFRFRRSKGEE